MVVVAGLGLAGLGCHRLQADLAACSSEANAPLLCRQSCTLLAACVACKGGFGSCLSDGRALGLGSKHVLKLYKLQKRGFCFPMTESTT